MPSNQGVALPRNPPSSALNYVVPTHRDGAAAPRIKEAASGAAENTVWRVHENLDGVRERRIFFGFGFIPCVRQMFNQLRQNMIFPREERAVKARHNLFVCE